MGIPRIAMIDFSKFTLDNGLTVLLHRDDSTPLITVNILYKVGSKNEDPSGLLRDFKGYTARKTINAIEGNAEESRKQWLLWMMERAGARKRNVQKRQFWQHHNKPIELWSSKVLRQKIDYIHRNPVELGFVVDPIHWKYSSARNYADDETVFELDNGGIHLGMLEF